MKKLYNFVKKTIHYKCSLGFCLAKINLFNLTNFKKKIILLATPQHENLGDHAIAYSIKKLFNLSKIKYIELTTYQLLNIISVNKSNKFNNNIIVFCGGGNLGPLYPELSNIYFKIITDNPDSRIIFFPSSINFDKYENFVKYFNEFKNLIKKKENIKFFLRDSYSLKTFKETHCYCKLYPDSSLYLSIKTKTNHNNKCLIIFRKDKESQLSLSQKNQVVSLCKTLFSVIKFSDTNYKKNIFVFKRKFILNSYFKYISKFEYIITDKLHAMIFSYITKTKCIAFNNNNNKTRNFYETWFKNCDFIEFANEPNDIKKIIANPNFIIPKYKNINFDNYFASLIKEISLW